jgi:hypothetical protein
MIIGFLLVTIYYFKKTSIQKDVFILFVVNFIMIINISLQSFFRNNLENYFNSIYKYILFIIIILVFTYKFNINKKIFTISSIFWFIISIIQAITKTTWIDMFVFRTSYYPNRNLAIGFSPEPSFLSKMMIFFIILNEYLYIKKNISIIHKLIIELLSIFVILLTQSLTGYLLVTIYYFLKFLIIIIGKIKLRKYKIRVKYIFIFFIIILLLLMNLHNIAEYIGNKNFGRVQIIFDYFENFNFNYFINFLKNDVSLKARFIHFTGPISSFFSGNILGVGSPSYSTGGILSIVLENGLLGIFTLVYIIYLIIKKINSSFNKQMKNFLIYVFLFLPIYIFTDTLANPIFFMVIFILINKER